MGVIVVLYFSFPQNKGKWRTRLGEACLVRQCRSYVTLIECTPLVYLPIIEVEPVAGIYFETRAGTFSRSFENPAC